jgi:hypothetical protein
MSVDDILDKMRHRGAIDKKALSPGDALFEMKEAA